MAIGVHSDGFREIPGVAEGFKEDKARWSDFLRYLKSRGLETIDLIISDKSPGLIEVIPGFYPKAKWQRCMVHLYRIIFALVPHGKLKEVAPLLKAIHAQENKEDNSYCGILPCRAAINHGAWITRHRAEMQLAP